MKKWVVPSRQTLARQEMREAIARVHLSADPVWSVAAIEAVYLTCTLRKEFISDDVWSVGCLDATREDRALGPVMLKAKKLGWCEKTGEMRPSVRSHLSGKPVWRSLLVIERR